jgi:DUF4097 and DUF4098 domain-containing protein YvlB
MNRYRRPLAAALLAALCAPSMAGTPIDQRKPANANVRVEVANVRGAVNVSGWERNEVALTGTLGEDSKLEFSGSESSLSIRVEQPDSGGWSWWGNRGPKEDTILELKVPRAAALDIDTVSADVLVDAISGSAEVRVESVSGDQRADAEADRVSLQSVSGDVAIRGSSRRSELETVSGDIIAEGLSEELEARSVSGEIDVRGEGFSNINGGTVSGDIDITGSLTERARVDLESMSGNLDLDLAGELSARIEVETFSGSIRSDYGTVEREEHGPGASLRTTVGSGSATLNLESFSGDVTIRKGG